MENVLSSSARLPKLVAPEVARLQPQDPKLARRLKRAAERVEVSVLDAACEIGRVRTSHWRNAEVALREVEGCLRAADGAGYGTGQAVDGVLGLTQKLLAAASERTSPRARLRAA